MAAYPISANELNYSATSGDARVSGLTAPITCGTCGCRLDSSASANGSTVWRHFSGTAGHDARGCSVACASIDHDAQGHPLS
jgi:hypothetical protein